MRSYEEKKELLSHILREALSRGACLAFSGGADSSALLAACNVATTLAGIPRNGQGDTRISIGKLSAGEGRNVVPVHAQMQIEVRGQTEAINQYMVDNVERIVKGVSEAYGVDYTIEKVGAATNLETSPEVSDTLEEIAKTYGVQESIIPQE